MQLFRFLNTRGVGDFISAVSGSTGNYTVTLEGGYTYAGFNEALNLYGTAAPVVGDLCLFGSATGAGDGRKPVNGDIQVIPSALTEVLIVGQGASTEPVRPTMIPIPADGSTGASQYASWIGTCSEPCTCPSGGEGVTMNQVSDGTPVLSVVSFADSVLTVNPNSGLPSETEFSVTIPADLIFNASGVAMAETVFTFTTEMGE